MFLCMRTAVMQRRGLGGPPTQPRGEVQWCQLAATGCHFAFPFKAHLDPWVVWRLGLWVRAAGAGAVSWRNICGMRMWRQLIVWCLSGNRSENIWSRQGEVGQLGTKLPPGKWKKKKKMSDVRAKSNILFSTCGLINKFYLLPTSCRRFLQVLSLVYLW